MRESFFETVAGKLAQHRRRKRRRLHIHLDGIEPQSKNMAPAEKDAFQAEILRALKEKERSAFRGPLALSIDLETTKATAPQAHTIAKNLLDLLGVRRPTVQSSQQHLLYKDDSQIHALSVSCVHGRQRPTIMIRAMPLGAMVEDLELAADALQKIEQDDSEAWYRRDEEQEAMSSFRRLVQHEHEQRRRLGHKLYDAMVKMERWHAQRALLGGAGVSTAQLSWLFGRPKNPFMRPLNDMWNGIIRRSPVRIDIGELPIATGTSATFKQRIDAELASFKQKWDWLISPLVVPVGLDVIVRPSANTPKGVLHDLDNIVRDYLLPRVVPKFGTVTDHRWLIDFDDLRRRDPKLAASWGPNPQPPKGTREGVTQYQAWRLPPASQGEKGFVSVALVADTEVRGDFFQRMDGQIKRFAELSKRH